MKKRNLLSIAAVALALVASISVPTTAYAVSRTTATEIVAVARTLEEVNGPQVLGATRTSNPSLNVKTEAIKETAVVEALTSTEVVAKIINDVIASVPMKIIANKDTNNNTASKTITSSDTTSAGTAVSEVKANDITVIDTMDVTLSTGTEVSEEKPVYITFSFPGLTSNTEAYVLHFHNGTWEILDSVVSDGQITAKFTSFSPVAIVAKTNTLKGAVLGADRKKSPRTGDFSLILISACAVAACGAGYYSKKKML